MENNKRVSELIWAIDIQTECLKDLKNQLEESDALIQTLYQLVEYQQSKIKKLTKAVETKTNETLLNFNWN
jgi:hypothetical protein